MWKIFNIRNLFRHLFFSSWAKTLGDSEHIKSITIIPTAAAPFSNSLEVLLHPKYTTFFAHIKIPHNLQAKYMEYWNQIDFILCSQRWRSSIQSAKTRPGADYGSDHELLIVKFRLKLKKVGKTTRPFRHDLNQIPYDYTVEVRNRFKGLDLIECLMNYGMRFVTLYRRRGSRPSPWKRNAKKQNGCLGRPYK